MSNYSTILQLLREARQKIDDAENELAKLELPSDTGIDMNPETGLPWAQEEIDLVPPITVGETGLEVVGGEETDNFPDCCAVGDDTRFYCSGTLISPTIVVTAKHCENPTRVFLKGNNVFEPEAGEIINVVRTECHLEVDLQILILERPSQVRPRHVAQGDEVIASNTAIVAGFGHANLAGSAGYGIKRKAMVPVMSMACALPGDGEKYGCSENRELVAGHLGLRRDTCKGDSGGPLYIEVRPDEYYLLGATSRGSRNSHQVCGDGGIYVRVDFCLAWIRSVTGILIEGPRI